MGYLSLITKKLKRELITEIAYFLIRAKAFTIIKYLAMYYLFNKSTLSFKCENFPNSSHFLLQNVTFK